MNLPSFFQDIQILSLISVCVTFAGIVAYALWPSMQSRFDAAARLPLNEE